MKPHALSLALGAAASLAGLSVAAASCSISDPQIGVEPPPFTMESFQPFGDYLVHRCGTIDCHGQPGRNLRVWGCDGMRLDAGQTPNCVPDDAGAGGTTIWEYEATYRSLVALEPQVMSAVFAPPGCDGRQGRDGGAAYPAPASCHPEYLTFVEKARGLEAHKGGQLICITPPCPPGVPDPDPYDPQDVCIVSWLEARTDVAACGAALGIPVFPMPDASP